MERSLFAKIIDREIPATIEYEDESVIAIRDIAPVAPVHILVIPKKPLRSVNAIAPEDHVLIGHILDVAHQLATKFGIADSGYRVVTNVNNDGGQSVPHLHFHLLGGQPLGHMTSGYDVMPTSIVRPTVLPTAALLASSSTRFFWRDLAILLVAAIGLAFGYNELNPKRIQWVRPVYAHDTLSAAGTITPGDTMSSNNLSNAVNDAANDMERTRRKGDTNALTAASSTTSNTTNNVGKPTKTGVDSAKAAPLAPCFIAESGVVKEITYAQFVMFLKKPCVVLIDARIPESYQKGHIGSAININGTEAESPDVIQRLIAFPRDKFVLIYCDGGECELSHRVAEVLKNFGYGPIYIYTGGWAEWSKKQ